MGVTPTKIEPQALTLERLRTLLDPHRVYYRVVVDDIIQRADVTELQALVAGAKELKTQYHDFDGVIRAGEAALSKAQKR